MTFCILQREGKRKCAFTHSPSFVGVTLFASPSPRYCFCFVVILLRRFPEGVGGVPPPFSSPPTVDGRGSSRVSSSVHCDDHHTAHLRRPFERSSSVFTSSSPSAAPPSTLPPPQTKISLVERFRRSRRTRATAFGNACVCHKVARFVAPPRNLSRCEILQHAPVCASRCVCVRVCV